MSPQSRMNTDHNLVISLFMTFHQVINSIGGVIVDVVASIVINGGFEHRSSQTKCFNVNISCSASAPFFLI
jgi:hypothetical protein